MANAIKAAIAEAMKANKPNSGNRPPNLGPAEDSHKTCSSCQHWAAGTCKLYAYKTQPDQVCDSWTPFPT